MRFLGFLFLTVGFFGAAFITVRHADTEMLEWHTVEWGWYLAAFVVGVTGVILLRTSVRGTETQSHKLDADLQTMDTSLNQLVSKIESINNEREKIGVYDIHQMIDDELMEDLGAFVDARESLIHIYNMQSYADLMNEFAGAERNINRAWSASADGYINEVWICMERARQQMTRARSLLHQYQQK